MSEVNIKITSGNNITDDIDPIVSIAFNVGTMIIYNGFSEYEYKIDDIKKIEFGFLNN